MILSTLINYRLLIINRKVKKAKESKDDPDEEYLAAARAVTRCVDLFCKVEKVIKFGCLLQQEEAAESGDISEDEMERESREKRLSKL